MKVVSEDANGALLCVIGYIEFSLRLRLISSKLAIYKKEKG